ncbi:MAG: hypothetical protein K5840_00110 [Eubacterium sp.]|nr:hypothetical protein [Eubacterium sp.]
MFYKTLDESSNTREYTATFYGYNHNRIITDGEMYDMKNLTSNYYPTLSPRAKRNYIKTLSDAEWTSAGITVSSSYTGTLISGTATYTATEDVEGGFTYNLTYTVDGDLIAFCSAEIEYDTGETATYAATDIELAVPEDATTMTMTITAIPADFTTFDESDLDTAVSSFAFLKLNDKIRGMLLKDGELAYFIGDILYWNEATFDYSEWLTDDDGTSDVQMISMGAYILIFPLGLYLNTSDTTDYGYMGAEYTSDGTYESTWSFTPCDMDGGSIEYSYVQESEPSSASEGEYWLCTSADGGLYQYSESMSMWVAVSTTYVKISTTFTTTPDTDIFPSMFEAGDALYMNSVVDDINEGSIIQDCGYTYDGDDIVGGYIVVIGLIDTVETENSAYVYPSQTVTEDDPLVFERKIPKLDYVCLSQNRIWGCYRGEEDGTQLNEIYASKLGDFKNWYVYEGTAADSYALSIGDEGSEWTGAITYNGYPMFFKENIIYKIYGSYPAAYELYTYDCRGVQSGSGRSLAVVNEYLVYKSVKDICVFDGNTPTSISAVFGDKRYTSAVAGAAVGKYYVSMLDEDGLPELFVYDMDRGVWHKEDDLRITQFVYNNSGELYGHNGLTVYGFMYAADLQGDSSESTIDWMAEFGDWGLDYIDHKYYTHFNIRAWMEFGASMDIYLAEDDGEWSKVFTIQGEGKLKMYQIPVHTLRCSHMRLRIEGRGDAKVYMISREVETGSDYE